MESISVFLDIANFLISGKNMLRSAELKVGDHHCRICVTDFKQGASPIREQPRMKPMLNRVNRLSKISLDVEICLSFMYRSACRKLSGFFFSNYGNNVMSLLIFSISDSRFRKTSNFRNRIF